MDVQTRPTGNNYPLTPTTVERRLKIKEYLEEAGLWNVNLRALGREYGVGHNVIKNDIDKIIESTDFKSLTHTTFALNEAYKKSAKEMLKLLITGDKHTKIRASDTLARINSGYIDFLEKFGIKEKIAEKSINLHGIEGEITVKWVKPKELEKND